MTTTAASIYSAEQGRTVNLLVRRLARAAGSLLAAIGSRWNAFAEGGQLGPHREREIGRHTGARI